MDLKTLIAAAVAAAFAFPALANDSAKHDKSAASGASSSQSSDKSAATGSSGAQAGGDFKSLDKNHDGSLSKDELKGNAQASNFDKLDKNHDGKLSQDEYNAAGKSAATGSSTSKQESKTSK